MSLQQTYPGIYMSAKGKKELASIDSIVFDCDGVLIDVSLSYDATIRKTADHILRNTDVKDPIPITPDIIEGFKATGGFNDEVDLTYAAILGLYAAQKLGEDPNNFIFKVIQNADETGIASVERFLDGITDISPIKKKLDYPGRHDENLLYLTFDQIFYGSDLFFKLRGKNSAFSNKGLIENDQILLNTLLLSELKKRFGKKIALVTGRGLESVRYPLQKMLDEFDLDNSFFLEDEPRSLAKPNPASLINSVSGMNSAHCLYVGDSAEDLIMAQKSSQSHKVTFCGIIGTSKNPQKKLALFEEKGASIILDSIDLLPKALNQALDYDISREGQ